MNQFLQIVRETRTPAGSAALWRLGQMGLLIKMCDTVLCVDYYASESPGRLFPPPVPAEELTGIDLFLGTHDHLDHIDHASWRIWAGNNPRAQFIFPSVHLKSVLEDGVPAANGRGLDDGESMQCRGVTVHAVAAAHEFLSPDPVTGRYPCLQYVIEGNGIRIYHAGDTLRYEGMLGKLRRLGPFDAALLPINGRDGKRYRRGCIGNMTFQEAADLAGELRPRLVIPGHWDLFADNPGDPEAFADYLDAKYPGQMQVLNPERLATVLLTAG